MNARVRAHIEVYEPGEGCHDGHRGPAEAAEGGTMSALCTWCGTEYEPRSNGGRPQRFCSAPCRRAFETACRIWGAAEYEAERGSIFALRTAFYERARCVESNPASERSQGPSKPGRALTGLSGARRPWRT